MGRRKEVKTDGEESARIRVQVDFTEGSLAQVEALKGPTDTHSRNDVIQNALRVYGWLVAKALRSEGISLGNDDLRMMLGMRAKLTDFTPAPRQES